MEIKLTFSKHEIVQRVKAKAHKRGMTDIAAKGDAAVKFAYNEQAGDDENDTFLLMSALRTSLDKLKAFIGEFLRSDGTNVADNIFDDLTNENDVFNLTLVVSARFNMSMTQPLADLGSRYIEDDMCVAWYTPISADNAQIYLANLKADELDITRCFLKVSPSVPTHTFPTYIDAYASLNGEKLGVFTVSTTNSGWNKHVSLTGLTVVTPSAHIGNNIVISYSLTKDLDGNEPIDDIVCDVDNNNAEVTIKDNQYNIICKHVGETVISLYSKHNTSVYCQMKIEITL